MFLEERRSQVIVQRVKTDWSGLYGNWKYKDTKTNVTIHKRDSVVERDGMRSKGRLGSGHDGYNRYQNSCKRSYVRSEKSST